MRIYRVRNAYLLTYLNAKRSTHMRFNPNCCSPLDGINQIDQNDLQMINKIAQPGPAQLGMSGLDRAKRESPADLLLTMQVYERARHEDDDWRKGSQRSQGPYK